MDGSVFMPISEDDYSPTFKIGSALYNSNLWFIEQITWAFVVKKGDLLGLSAKKPGDW